MDVWSFNFHILNNMHQLGMGRRRRVQLKKVGNNMLLFFKKTTYQCKPPLKSVMNKFDCLCDAVGNIWWWLRRVGGASHATGSSLG